MPSRAVVRFLATTLLLVLARGFDAWTTWVATPDLQLELNPLERLLHLGWWGLFVMNGLVVGVMASAAWSAAFRPPRLPAEPNLDRPAFVGRYWFSRGESSSIGRAALWLPADRRVRWAFIGGPGAVLVIVTSFVAGGWNLLVAHHFVVGRTAGSVGIAAFWGTVLVGLYLAVRTFLIGGFARYARADRPPR